MISVTYDVINITKVPGREDLLVRLSGFADKADVTSVVLRNTETGGMWKITEPAMTPPDVLLIGLAHLSGDPTLEVGHRLMIQG